MSKTKVKIIDKNHDKYGAVGVIDGYISDVGGSINDIYTNPSCIVIIDNTLFEMGLSQVEMIADVNDTNVIEIESKKDEPFKGWDKCPEGYHLHCYCDFCLEYE